MRCAAGHPGARDAQAEGRARPLRLLPHLRWPVQRGGVLEGEGDAQHLGLPLPTCAPPRPGPTAHRGACARACVCGVCVRAWMWVGARVRVCVCVFVCCVCARARTRVGGEPHEGAHRSSAGSGTHTHTSCFPSPSLPFHLQLVKYGGITAPKKLVPLARPGVVDEDISGEALLPTTPLSTLCVLPHARLPPPCTAPRPCRCSVSCPTPVQPRHLCTERGHARLHLRAGPARITPPCPTVGGLEPLGIPAVNEAEDDELPPCTAVERVPAQSQLLGIHRGITDEAL